MLESVQNILTIVFFIFLIISVRNNNQKFLQQLEILQKIESFMKCSCNDHKRVRAWQAKVVQS